MKIKVIACAILTRELGLAAAKSKHVIDLTFLQSGLHSTPDVLRQAIQAEIDKSENLGYSYLVLGYGLCSRGTADLIVKSVPVVIPKAHDCITLFLGSRSKYDEVFNANPGTYYFTSGWIERMDGEASQGGFEDAKAKAKEERLKEYTEKYGEDNAVFLLEQESGWLQNYTHAVFIDTKVGQSESYRNFTKNLAKDRNWEYSEIESNLLLIEKIADGDFDNDDFLIAKPGSLIAESFDSDIIKCRSCN